MQHPCKHCSLASKQDSVVVRTCQIALMSGAMRREGHCILGAIAALGRVPLRPIGRRPLAALMQMEQRVHCRIYIQPASHKMNCWDNTICRTRL